MKKLAEIAYEVTGTPLKRLWKRKYKDEATSYLKHIFVMLCYRKEIPLKKVANFLEYKSVSCISSMKRRHFDRLYREEDQSYINNWNKAQNKLDNYEHA